MYYSIANAMERAAQYETEEEKELFNSISGVFAAVGCTMLAATYVPFVAAFLAAHPAATASAVIAAVKAAFEGKNPVSAAIGAGASTEVAGKIAEELKLFKAS